MSSRAAFSKTYGWRASKGRDRTKPAKEITFETTESQYATFCQLAHDKLYKSSVYKNWGGFNEINYKGNCA